MQTEARKKASSKYKKLNTKNISLRFYINTEQDLITHLEKQPNKQGYIKKLIREDMDK